MRPGGSGVAARLAGRRLRWRALVIILASGFLLPLLGAAAEARQRQSARLLDIRVNAAGFGRVSAEDIATVLRSAAGEIRQHCPEVQLGGIDIYRRRDRPQTDERRTRAGRISIGLAAHDAFWAQYAFQMAHEYCHALAQFGGQPQRRERYAARENLWLEESLCETASLFALRAMSRSWETAPPYPEWRGYAPALGSYARERLARPEHQLPAGVSFAHWFELNHPILRKSPELRAKNAIVASQLLPLFEAEPEGWQTVAWLNRSLEEANKPFARHLADWRQQCPPTRRSFVAKIAAAFSVRLPKR